VAPYSGCWEEVPAPSSWVKPGRSFFVQKARMARLFSLWSQPPSDQYVPPDKTMCHQFWEELVGRATSLCQPLFQRGMRGIEQTFCAQHMGSLRKRSSVHSSINRASAQTEVVSDPYNTRPVRGEEDDLFRTGLPSEVSTL
jgi:hypothetical protein